jgi:membrane protein insertase Oxa1/YidC/SpoIIIJ
MEDILKELILQAPWGVAILVVVMSFLRYLSKYNEAMTSAMRENSQVICKLANALARLEERVESMQQELRSKR